MKLTVLISSCGRRVELLEAFRSDARALGIDVRVLGSDVDIETSAAARRADKAFFVPKINAPEFLPQLLALCQSERIDLIIPTIDPGIMAFSESRDRFAAVGTNVVVSEHAVARIANNKLRTYEFLTNAGLPTPRTLTIEDARSDSTRCSFPLIAKPISGSGSVGIRQIQHAVELYDPALDQGYLVQEFIKGTEFTVNLYFDLAQGRLRCAIPHKRIEVRAGEVAKGVTMRHPKLEQLADELGAKLAGARGCICFQAIEDAAGAVHIIEINARFGGGFPLAHRAGARFTAWLMEETLGLPSTIGNDWRENVLMTRYDAAVFLND
ncbi:MAG: hypothetical protein C0518_01000 [Opitutus sp.]|nr:hypothetical protein [Opitutus sp.]